MSTNKINIKTVIAVLLLIVDVLAIRWSVDAITENRMHHNMTIVSHRNLFINVPLKGGGANV